MSPSAPDARASFQIDLLGHRVRIAGPAREIDLLRESLFSRCQAASEASPAEEYEIAVEGSRFRLLRKGRQAPVLETDDRNDLFWWLDTTLCEDALDRAEGLVEIHGAAAARNGKGIIILGDSHAGKTSLVLHLLRNGCGFLADEVVLLDMKTALLRPFPRNLLVREGALSGDEALARLCRGMWSYEDGRGEEKWFVDPSRLGPAPIPPSARPEMIVRLERSREGPARLESLGMRAAVENLLREAVNLDVTGGAGVDALIRLTGGVRNLRLRAPDPGAAWASLWAAVSGDAGRAEEEGRRVGAG